MHLARSPAEVGGVTKRKAGRYDDIYRATHPGTLPREGQRARGKIEIVTAAIEDPNPTLKGKRQRVAINRLTDVLEREYSCHRISTAAYNAGRAYQAVAEAARGLGSTGSSFEPSSGAGDRELAFARRIDCVALFVAWNENIRMTVGAWSALIIDGAILDGLTLSEIARHAGYSSQWARSRVADDFRQSLETLAREWEQKGYPGGS
jgi:hypothetical protein